MDESVNSALRGERSGAGLGTASPGGVIGSTSDIAELGTIVGIWAHPDDEAYLSGGLMALAREAGCRVVCVTATRGELGTPDPLLWPPERLAAERTREMASCMEILGVVEHHWLGYRDGQCATVDASDAVNRLGEIIGAVGADTVLTFGPDGYTGHPDHQSVGTWAAEAFDQVARPGARLLQAAVSESRHRVWGELNDRLGVFEPGYPIIFRDDQVVVDLLLDQATAGRKVTALMAQETQTAGLIAALGIHEYTTWVSGEVFVERRPNLLA